MLVSSAAFAVPSTGQQYEVRIDDTGTAGSTTFEIVYVTANNTGTNTLTWTRGQDGTSPHNFAAGATVTTTVGNATLVGMFPVKLEEQLVGGGAAHDPAAPAASITFYNPLPTGYRHLEIEWYARGDTAATSTGILLRFNNDSAANYDTQKLWGNAATTTAAESLAATSIAAADMPANTATAAYFGTGRILIPHYAGTTGNKTAVSNYGYFTANTTGTGFSQQNIGKWRTTATAITRLDLIPAAGNFASGSLFILRGMA